MNHEHRVMLLDSLSSLTFAVVRVSRREVGKLPYLLMRGIKIHKLFLETIHDVGLACLAAGCGTLTAVDLSRFTYITDVGLTSLAAGCRDLLSLIA